HHFLEIESFSNFSPLKKIGFELTQVRHFVVLNTHRPVRHSTAVTTPTRVMGLRQFVAVLWALVKRFNALTTRCTYIALATVPIFLIALAYFTPVPLEFFNSFAPPNNHSTTCTFLYVRTTPARYKDLFGAAYK